MTEQEEQVPVISMEEAQKEKDQLLDVIQELREKVLFMVNSTEQVRQIVTRAATGDPYIAMRIFRIWTERYLTPGLTPQQQFSKITKAFTEYADEQFQIELLTELSSHGISYDEYADAILSAGRDELKSTLQSFWQNGFQYCFTTFVNGDAFKRIVRDLEGVEIEEQSGL